MNLSHQRDGELRRALAGEAPVTPLVTVCGYCPDRVEQTAAARAHGFEVSHGMCVACAARLHAEMDRREAHR